MDFELNDGPAATHPSRQHMTSYSPAPTLSLKTRDHGGAGVSRWKLVSFTLTHAVAAFLLSVLSLSGLYRLGQLFGTLEWLINYKRRRRFAAAFQRVLGYKPTAGQRRRETREFFIRSRCDKLFYLIFDCVPRDKAMTLFSIGNQGLLDDALARGRGVYLAMSHHGDHHVIGMLLALKGYRTAAVRDRHEGALRRFVQERFDRRYPGFPRMRVLFADGFPRDAYRCLQDGYVLGSAMDIGRVRNPNQKTEEVTIFGEKRSFLSGPLRIAIRCRAPVLQACIRTDRSFRYHLEIADVLVDPDNVGDEATAIRQAMRAYAANVEKHIRESPSLLSRI